MRDLLEGFSYDSPNWNELYEKMEKRFFETSKMRNFWEKTKHWEMFPERSVLGASKNQADICYYM